MYQTNTQTNEDSKLLDVLLSPSLLSGTLAIVFSVGTVGMVLYGYIFKTSYNGLQFAEYQSTQFQNAVGKISDRLAQNTLLSDAPLFIFWALVGTAVYLLTMNIIQFGHDTSHLKEELEEYTNLDRNAVLKSIAYKFAARVGVLAIWLVYVHIFFRVLVPYGVALSAVGAGDIRSLQGVCLVVAALVLLAAAYHVHVVLLRLLLLRPRVFSEDVFIS